jgi:alkaline phosphatase
MRNKIEGENIMENRAKQLVIIFFAVILIAPSVFAAQNVIVLVPDGCDQSVVTAARWYKQHVLNDEQPLALDEMGVTGMVKTHMANSVITGSAAAATAFATGEKTTVRFLGVGPDPVLYPNLSGFNSTIAPYAPIQSVLEAAKLKGKAVGLVSTSRITHATPAAYASHIQDRGMDNEIMEHLVYQDLDVVFGGGKRHLLPTEEGGKRTDGENLIDVLLERGYQFVETAEDLDAARNRKIWGMFADSHMSADIDRAEFAPGEPSIAEMTAKAIKILKRDDDGFFLMVEGSQVDWAGHNNDPIYMITDFLAFDAAVAKALKFAKKSDTVVYVFPDHDTGSMSIGHKYAFTGYTDTSVEDLVEPLAGMKITSYALEQKLNEDYSHGNIKNVVYEWWGLEVTDADIEQCEYLMDVEGLSFNYALASVVCENHTVFGWTTYGHTGEDVPLWSYYDGEAAAVGIFDNTDMAKLAAKALGLRLRKSRPWRAYPHTILDHTDPANPVAVVGNKRYPVGKDIKIKKNGTIVNLMGVTVYNKSSDMVYIPKR